MRIAITGIRGIPNRYGGFEQFVEKLSVRLSSIGNEIWSYNPHYHAYKDSEFFGVRIYRKRTFGNVMGSANNFLFDFSCITHANKQKPDIILECGYATAAPWYPFLRRKGIKLVTQMDGMEWQRAKWGWITRKLILLAESTAVKYSDAIVCDHPEIAEYYREKYSVEPNMIPYGADIREEWNVESLSEIGIKPGTYYMLVARLEPENKIELIIDGFLASPAKEPLLIVGDYSRKYGQKIHREYRADKRLKFLGGIFESKKLDHLRHYSIASFHGHSVGGTNPSLLEAMAAGSLIFAHKNPYNKWILGENAGYFRSTGELSNCIKDLGKLDRDKFISNNLDRIRADFQWDSIVQQYEELFKRLINQ